MLSPKLVSERTLATAAMESSSAFLSVVLGKWGDLRLEMALCGGRNGFQVF